MGGEYGEVVLVVWCFDGVVEEIVVVVFKLVGFYRRVYLEDGEFFVGWWFVFFVEVVLRI